MPGLIGIADGHPLYRAAPDESEEHILQISKIFIDDR